MRLFCRKLSFEEIYPDIAHIQISKNAHVLYIVGVHYIKFHSRNEVVVRDRVKLYHTSLFSLLLLVF